MRDGAEEREGKSEKEGDLCDGMNRHSSPSSLMLSSFPTPNISTTKLRPGCLLARSVAYDANSGMNMFQDGASPSTNFALIPRSPSWQGMGNGLSTTLVGCQRGRGAMKLTILSITDMGAGEGFCSGVELLKRMNVNDSP